MEDLYDEFGAGARQFAERAACYVLEAIRAEEKRIADGWAYEPPTFYEINSACQRLFANEYPQATPCRYVALSPGTREAVQQRRA